MNVGITQSQSLIAVARFSGTGAKIQGPASGKDAPSSGLATDVVEVSAQVDEGFVSRVLQDSLEERLNVALEKAGVEMSAGELLASETDTSPQATATRITDFAVSFYAAYQGNHQDQEGAVQLEGFVELVKGAVEEGFTGARELLDGFAEMSEDIEGDIDETFELTMRGIDSFAEEQRQTMEQGEEEVGPI